MRHDFHVQERQIHEDEEFGQTLSALDDAEDVGPSHKAHPSPSRPPAKKLKLMMDKVPVGQSPSKTPKKTPTKEKQSEWVTGIYIPVFAFTGHLTQCSPWHTGGMLTPHPRSTDFTLILIWGGVQSFDIDSSSSLTTPSHYALKVLLGESTA